MRIQTQQQTNKRASVEKEMGTESIDQITRSMSLRCEEGLLAKLKHLLDHLASGSGLEDAFCEDSDGHGLTVETVF